MSHGKSFHCLIALTIKQSLFVDFLGFIARRLNNNAPRVERSVSCTMEKLSSATKLSACILCSRRCCRHTFWWARNVSNGNISYDLNIPQLKSADILRRTMHSAQVNVLRSLVRLPSLPSPHTGKQKRICFGFTEACRCHIGKVTCTPNGTKNAIDLFYR